MTVLSGKLRIIAALLLILAAFPLRAQWSGQLNLSAGLGGMNGDEKTGIGYLGHVLARGNAGLHYQSEKFTMTTVVNGLWEPKSSDNTRLNLNLEQQDQVDLELVYKTVKTRPLKLGIRSDFGWKPSRERNYSAWISYQYQNDRARNVSNSLSGTLNLAGMDKEQLNHFYESPSYILDLFNRNGMDAQQASCYFEKPRMDEHQVAAGGHAVWQLNARSLLEGTLSLSTTGSRRNTIWSVFKTSETIPDDYDEDAAFREGKASMYRITPSTIDLDFAADIHLRRTVRDDGVRFNWTPGLRFSGNHSLDRNSGATLSGITQAGSRQWRDSLRLRESFDFLYLNAAPFAALEYCGKKIEIHADYSIQFYFRRLNNEEQRQALMMLPPSPVGNARLDWKISDVHKVGVTHEVGVDYPDFLEICWYDRSGGYIDQLFRGNVDLISTLHSRYGIVYELKYRRFRYRTDNFITRRINEIDQTWTNEEIEGRLYKVFSWVNSDDSWSFGTAHRLGWEGSKLKAGVGMELNQTRRIAKKDRTIKNASDWRLTADVEALLGKGWSLGANVEYQSKVATFFTSFNEYWELNSHIQKKFRNVTLYLDGRDLLDNARQNSFRSEDGKELWVDVARQNRRLFLLGVKWDF